MLSAIKKFPVLRRIGKNQFVRKSCIATTLTATGVLAFGAPLGINNFDPGENVRAGLRFLRSLHIGAVITLDYYIADLRFNEQDEDFDSQMSKVHTRSAKRILQGCLLNGGTYVKIGQGLVSLSHLLPKEYITVLSKLHDQCLTRCIGEVELLFQQDFGKTPYAMYAKFEPEPIAAGSLAQVFKATTFDNAEVAVKIQYIDLQTRFDGDVATINFLCRMAGIIYPKFGFDWILNDIIESLKDELDFMKEGHNAERCANDLKHLSYIHVPKVYWNLCSKRVLVAEYINGIKIDDKKELGKQGHQLADIDTKLFTAFGEQIFKTGFIHADPHPGNIHVRKHNNETQLVLMDHGLYQDLSEKDRLSLSHFWKALVLKDYVKMQKYAKDLGVDDYSMLAEVLTQRPLKSRQFQLISKLSDEDLQYMKDFARERFDVIMKTLKTMPRSLLLVTRNLNTIRAIAHDHGDPIDRYTLLARAATKTAFESNNFFKRIYLVPVKMCFEIQLAMNKMWVWFIKSFFTLLHKLGRSPDADSVLSLMG